MAQLQVNVGMVSENGCILHSSSRISCQRYSCDGMIFQYSVCWSR